MMILISKSELLYLLMIAMGVVAVLAIVVTISVLLGSHVHIKRQVRDIIRNYEHLRDLINNGMESELKKIQSISKINEDYVAIFEMNDEAFRDMKGDQYAQATSFIKELDRLLVSKKYKQVKEQLDECRIKVANLTKVYNKLNNSIATVISVDEENRADILKFRRKFRNIRDSYENKKSELKYVEKSFDAVFSNLEKLFVETEKLLSAAYYEEAKLKFPEIEKVLNELEYIILDMPKLVTSAFYIIPNEITRTLDRYDQLIEDGYPLHHLKVKIVLDEYSQIINNIQNKLHNFKIRKVEQDLTMIRDELLNLNNCFDQEVTAKEYFFSNYDVVYNGSYDLLNKFIKLNRLVPKFKKTYCLRESCDEELSRIEQEINQLDQTKRTLDNYVHSNSKQPFSILAKRLEELESTMKNIDDSINKINEYFNSLKKTTEDIYQYIGETFITLKKFEAELRNIDVPTYSLSYKSLFNHCYELLDSTGKISQELPINVDALKQNITEFKYSFDNIESALNGVALSARQAEEAITNANRYRQSILSVRQGLQKIEKAFFEGNFNVAFDGACKLIKSVRPE